VPYASEVQTQQSLTLWLFYLSFHLPSSYLAMGVWQGVAMDSLKFYPGPPCPTFIHRAGRPHLKRPNCRFRGGPPTGRAAFGCLLPHWTPHAVRLWYLATRKLTKTDQCHSGVMTWGYDDIHLDLCLDASLASVEEKPRVSSDNGGLNVFE
jgi:hypothetical protein